MGGVPLSPHIVLLFMTREEFISNLATKFINMDSEVGHALYNALYLNRNIILYGEGGHAKSEVALYAASLFYQTPIFVASLDKYTTPSSLVGTADIPALIQQGQYRHNVAGSIMEHEVAILEEGLDSRISTILKDVLTRGAYCTGGMCYPMQTRCVIMCTNVEPDTWAENDSDRALLRRFHYKVKVAWKSYKPSDFMSMYALRFPADKQEALLPLAETVAAIRTSGALITPAEANVAASAFLSCGKEGLIGLSHFGPKQLQYLRDYDKRKAVDLLIEEVTIKYKLVQSMDIAQLSQNDFNSVIGELSTLLTQLGSCRPDNNQVKLVADLHQRIKALKDKVAIKWEDKLVRDKA